MPYPKETASGESLLRWLEHSPELEEFKKKFSPNESIETLEPNRVNIARRYWTPRRVIAIDGSHITVPLNRHFPVREAGLIIVSAVSINLNLLRNASQKEIPRPKIFHDMEKAMSFVRTPIPGAHLSDPKRPSDTAVSFFREAVHQIFSHDSDSHETLLGTLLAITQPDIPGKSPFTPNSECPAEGCTNTFSLNKIACPTCGEKWYATDVLRLHEYFNEDSSSKEAHSRLRATIEVIVLLNFLRFSKRIVLNISPTAFLF